MISGFDNTGSGAVPKETQHFPLIIVKAKFRDKKNPNIVRFSFSRVVRATNVQEQDCEEFEFYNRGNTLALINDFPLYPNTDYTISFQNPQANSAQFLNDNFLKCTTHKGDIDLTEYKISFPTKDDPFYLGQQSPGTNVVFSNFYVPLPPFAINL